MPVPNKKFELRTMSLSDIRPHPHNWRLHPDAQKELYRRSYEALGSLDAIVLNETTGHILDGHLRYEEALKRGDKKIQVLVGHWTEAEEAAALLIKDTIAGMAEPDKGEIVILEQQIKIDLPDMDALVRELETVKIDMSSILDDGVEVVEDDVPEPPKEPVTKVGDLYILDGKHRVLCGDSTKKEDMERLMGGKKADMVYTDPPYAVFGSCTGIQADIVDDRMIRPFFEATLITIRDNTKANAHLYIHCDWRSYSSWWEVNRAVRLSPKNMIVWHKPNARMGSMYSNSHELLLFWTNKPIKQFMTKDQEAQRTVLGETNVWTYTINTTAVREHFAEKPIAVGVRAIGNSTDKGEIVLDTFLGSGTTLMASQQLGRICYGMDVEPRFVDVAIARYKKQYPDAKVEVEHGKG